jgi:hypothetical protein
MNILFYVFVWTLTCFRFLGYILRSGIPMTLGNSKFEFFRNCQNQLYHFILCVYTKDLVFFLT